MIKWLKETYVDIPTQPGWIGLVLAVCMLVLLMS